MRRGRLAAAALAGAAVLLALAVAGVWRGVVPVPDRWNPWAPLDLRQPPNLLAGWKLWRLQREPALCEAALATADLAFERVPDRESAEGCGLENVVRVSRSGVAFSSSFLVTCRMAAGLALFERHRLQPAAARALGQPVARIDHLGSYACRNIGSGATGRRSQHATANAFDIAGFVLRDGTRVSVARDWDGAGPKGRFLREARDGACDIFRVVLGPEYNAAHRDHFHLDMGGFGLCR